MSESNPTNIPLFQEFLSQEANAYVRELLLNFIAEQRAAGSPAGKTFNFNRFDVTLDFAHGTVVLEDDLMMGPESDCTMRIDELERALRNQ